jgi:glycine betaine/proline transport system substrate-binding protein
MRINQRRGTRLLALSAITALALTACGGGAIEEETQANEEQQSEMGDCGEINMAVNPWVGYYADAYVVGHIAESELGCTVNYKELKEDVSWQGFGTGEVDVVIEDWGHPDLEKQFFAEQGDGSAMDGGPTGNTGIIGWYVPPWLAEEHPEVLDYQNLNDFADDFATSETGDKGQFLGADPSYVQFDEAIIDNLGLDFEVVFSGSEAASITAFQQAEKNQEFLIGYFYEPQWLFAELELQKVQLPPYEEGCQDDPAEVDCDYPETELKKILSTSWVEEGGPGVELVENFSWTNEDQNQVAAYISDEGMSNEDAAARWVEENPDIWEAWMPQ